MPPDKARAEGLTSTITFCRGNLAPEGSVVKSTAIDPSVIDADGVFRMTGPARIFHRESDAMEAIKAGRIHEGDIMVLTCAGPMGSGMEEIYQITSALKFLSFGKEVAVITDARFSGVSTGACIGHVGPEALAGGPIGKVRESDSIQIIIDRNTLEGTIDLVGEKDSAESGPEVGERLLEARGTPDYLSPPSRSTRRHPALGCVAGGERGRLGWMCFRRGRDCRSASSVGRLAASYVFEFRPLKRHLIKAGYPVVLFMLIDDRAASLRQA